MAITKETVVDQVTVTENGIVLYREATRIIEDGKVLTQTYHRTSLTPGQESTERLTTARVCGPGNHSRTALSSISSRSCRRTPLKSSDSTCSKWCASHSESRSGSICHGWAYSTTTSPICPRSSTARRR